jgi:hypothetical protein
MAEVVTSASMRYLLCLLLVGNLLAQPALAKDFASLVAAATLQVPPGTDSQRAHILSLLAKGEVDQAMAYWVVATGKEAPRWLLALKTSYDASKQIAGKCQDVAHGIHHAFTQLGAKPQLLELTTANRKDIHYIVFRMLNGKDVNISKNGYHVVVRLGDRAYDAYTGPAGMPWNEYMSRIGARGGIVAKVVESFSEAGP